MFDPFASSPYSLARLDTASPVNLRQVAVARPRAVMGERRRFRFTVHMSDGPIVFATHAHNDAEAHRFAERFQSRPRGVGAGSVDRVSPRLEQRLEAPVASSTPLTMGASLEDRTLHLTASSEYPVDRGYEGREILVHSPAAVRMGRLNGGAPLLFNHNPNDIIGIVDSGNLSGRKLKVQAHLFTTARAAEVGQMIAGGLRNVSLMYAIHEVEHDDVSGDYRISDWSPMEVSVVSIPADPTVGVGRGHD